MQPGEARFGLELDGGKGVAEQIAGSISGAVYVGRQESGSLRHAMVGGPVAAAEITAKPKWAAKTGPGATSGAAAKAL